MRPILLLLFVIMPYLSSFGQHYNLQKTLERMPKFEVSTARFSAYLYDWYQQTAGRLALDITRSKVPKKEREIAINRELQQSIFNSLVAVRLSDYAAVDSVFRLYKIIKTTLPDASTCMLVVKVPYDYISNRGSKREDTITRISPILKQFNAMHSRLVYLDEDTTGIVIYAEKPIDMEALGEKLHLEADADPIEIMEPWGDSHRIGIILTAEGWEFTFNLRWEDCVINCKKSYNWKFLVSDTGKVTYLGGSGNSIPPWLAYPYHRSRLTDTLKN